MSASGDLVRWSEAVGPVTAHALAILHDVTAPSARARLAAAERAGVMCSSRPLAGRGALYVPTRAGMRECGLSGVPPPPPSAAGARHAGICADAAARLQRLYPCGWVVGEAGLRRLERASGRPVASARLPRAANAGSPIHRPDLVLWASGLPNGLPIAIEVELTVKGSDRLRGICSAWARARCVAGVIYVVSPEAAGPVAAAIEHAKGSGRVSLLALEALQDLPQRHSPERTVAAGP